MRMLRSKPPYKGLAIAATIAVMLGLSSGPAMASALSKFNDTPAVTESDSAPATDLEPNPAPVTDPAPVADPVETVENNEEQDTQQGFTASRISTPSSNNTETQHVSVEICHADNNANQPYGPKRITVDDDAVDGVGGNDHYGQHTGPLASTTAVAQDLKDNHIQWGDIIPPLPGVHDGLNWTEEGQAIWNNDCAVPTPPVDVCPNISGTQTTPPAGYDPVTCEPPTNGCVTGTGETFTENNPMVENDMIGSYAYSYEDGYLKIVVNDGNSKVNLRSGNPPFLLKNTGVLNILGSNISGTVNGLGLNLYVDMDGDLSTTNDRGTLVFEEIYGQDLWVPGSAANAALAAVAPSHTGGNGSSNHGTINEWLTVIPNAMVLDWALNYGRIGATEWYVTQVTINCSDFTYDHYVEPPVVVSNNPKAVVETYCGGYDAEFSNDVTLGENEVSTDAHFEYTDENGMQVPVTLKPNDPHIKVTITYPEDSGTHAIAVGETGKTVEYVVESDCEPNLVSNNPKAVVETYCGGYDAEFSNDVELGENEYADPVDFEYTDENGAQQVVTAKPNDPHVKITVHYTEDSGTQTVTVGEKGGTEDYQIKADCLPPGLASTGQAIVGGILAAAGLLGVGGYLIRRAHRRPGNSLA